MLYPAYLRRLFRMRSAFSALVTYLVSHVRSHESLRLENMALRHQLAVYQRSAKRPRRRKADRLLWAWLSCLWPDRQKALAFVQPGTVITWRKRRFRNYRRRLSQPNKPGRPAISSETRELIRDMWRCNPTWGSPRKPTNSIKSASMWPNQR